MKATWRRLWPRGPIVLQSLRFYPLSALRARKRSGPTMRESFQPSRRARYVGRQGAVRFYSNETTAVANAYFTLTLVDRAGKANNYHGRITATAVKLGGRWLVVDQHLSVLPASPSGPPRRPCVSMARDRRLLQVDTAQC